MGEERQFFNRGAFPRLCTFERRDAFRGIATPDLSRQVEANDIAPLLDDHHLHFPKHLGSTQH
jgi:hypothetical protein